MPSVKAAICPAFAKKAKVDDQLVYPPRFFTCISWRLSSETGLVIIIQTIKQVPMDRAFTSCHTVLRASDVLSHLSLTMKFPRIMCSLYR